MPVGLYDINAAALTQNYDFIVSTVVLMFLDADRIPAIIRNMQEHTNPGGYHLIVCAMDTEDYPCQMPFSFTFKEGELAEYYNCLLYTSIRLLALGFTLSQRCLFRFCP